MPIENPRQSESENPLAKINEEKKNVQQSIASGAREALQGLKVEAIAGIGKISNKTDSIISSGGEKPVPTRTEVPGVSINTPMNAPIVQQATSIPGAVIMPTNPAGIEGGNNAQIDSNIETGPVTPVPAPSQVPGIEVNTAPIIQQATSIPPGVIISPSNPAGI